MFASAQELIDFYEKNLDFFQLPFICPERFQKEVVENPVMQNFARAFDAIFKEYFKEESLKDALPAEQYKCQPNYDDKLVEIGKSYQQALLSTDKIWLRIFLSRPGLLPFFQKHAEAFKSVVKMWNEKKDNTIKQFLQSQSLFKSANQKPNVETLLNKRHEELLAKAETASALDILESIEEDAIKNNFVS